MISSCGKSDDRCSLVTCHRRQSQCGRLAVRRSGCRAVTDGRGGAADAWRRPIPGSSRGGPGVPTWPSGPGARCGRTTASTARPGTTSRTTTHGRGPTGGTRTAWPASATTGRRSASRWRCGTARTRSSRSGCSASAATAATTARTPRSTGGTRTPRPPTPGCAGATTTRRPRSPTTSWSAVNAPARPRRARVRAGRHRASSTTTGTGRSPSTTPRPSPTDMCIAGHRRQPRPGRGDPARAAHAVVPQHLVLGAARRATRCPR